LGGREPASSSHIPSKKLNVQVYVTDIPFKFKEIAVANRPEAEDSSTGKCRGVLWSLKKLRF
jgi:hypothetical protein